MRRLYKPGDNVLPKLRRRRNREEDNADRHLMDEVRALSLREMEGNASQSSLEPPRPRERRSRSRDRQRRDRNHRSRESSANGGESAARPPRVTPSTMSGPPTARQVEHQSSLRSLMSASDLDSHELESHELEEEIMRQILQEGLLEGIDLDHIDRRQEEQIQERILQAYRRRQREQAGQWGVDGQSTGPTQGGADEAHTEVNQPPTHTSRPPISRPHLFEAASERPRHRRRTSSQGSSRSRQSDRDRERGLEVPTLNNSRASRSASDLSLESPRVEGSADRPRRASANTRRTTDPEGHPRTHAVDRATRGLAERRTNSNPSSPAPAQSQFSTTESRQHATFPIASRDASTSRPPSSHADASSPPAPTESATFPQMSGQASRSRSLLFTEPSIPCDRCNKQDIQYRLHYNCPKCNDGKFHLCQSCYRQGKGCLHWYGFTPATAATKHGRFSSSLSRSEQNEAPHVLVGHRYRHPKQPLVRSSSGMGRMVTDEDPQRRLEVGVFCEVCGAFANACYWKCDVCNDGAWGYCNDCDNQFRHCTHPLLPLSHKPPTESDTTQSDDTTAGAEQTNSNPRSSLRPTSAPEHPVTPRSASPLLGSLPPTIIAGLPFNPLTFHTKCDVCKYPISPSDTRYHCPECNHGDYDICKSCYHGLVAKGRIKREDGPHGWRRCPRGHRMGIVGFEDRVGGQWRIVVAERVGGLALKDEQQPSHRADANTATPPATLSTQWSWREDDGTLRQGAPGAHSPLPSPGLPPEGLMSKQRFPPSGGVGLRIHALYAWWPEDGARDELMFPKGAEITEAEDINGDWFWGCYAGSKGLFPGNYGKIVGRVEG